MAQRLAVKAGDKIGILSTARWIPTEDIDFADRIIRSWGLVPVYGKSIEARHQQFAGDDALRTNDLQRFLDDPSIKAILCARGGYGTIRIIGNINFTQFMQHPKLICGFSDITVLHTHINDKLGLPTLHSAMPVTFPKNTEQSLQTLRNALFGQFTDYDLPAHRYNQPGTTRAEIIGGNLSILYSLLGTKYGFSTNGKILFLEDLDEYLYHIDRMMMSMQLAGKFNGLKGLIVGGMSDMKDNTVPFGEQAEEIISRFAKQYQIPVCFGFPAGHIDDNRAIVFKKEVAFEVNDSGAMIRYI